MDEELYLTAADRAYQIISQKILDGEFQPGMKLSRRNMASVAGVSVIPVIEALKRLEEDSLVESRPKWGSFVTVPTKKKILESFQLREAIECQSARIMAEAMTEEQKEELWTIATKLDTVPYNAETMMDSRDYHLSFHQRLTEFTGNPRLMDTLRKINLFYVLCRAIRANAPKKDYPRYWHRYLVDEISSGDPDRAERAMREHVNDSLQLILKEN